jgi:hypothetical protein
MQIASRVIFGVVAAGLLFQESAFADASYQQTTQITGGSLMSMMKMASVFSSKARGLDKPVVSTVLLHGNKMARIGPTTTEIIDLDNQTITNIDSEHHQYSVMTFEQMKEAMANAAKQAREHKSAPAQDTKGQDVQMSFHAKVTNSGATRQIDGQEAKQALLTITMDAQPTDASKADASQPNGALAIASEMWLIPEAAGYEEIRDFNMRLAKELAANMDMGAFSAMFSAQPGASDAMADLQKESSKMTGIPVVQITRMGMTTNGQPLPPPSDTTTDAGNASSPEAKKAGESSANDRLASLGKMMGNASALGGFMHHKKSQNTDQESSTSPSSARSSSSDSTPQAATLLEMKTEMSNFSSGAVDLSKFEIPAGYQKKVDPRVKELERASHS